MHTDTDSRESSKANRLHIFVAIVLAAAAITAGIALGHPTPAQGASGGAALAPAAAAATTAATPRPGAGADASLPDAADALHGNVVAPTEAVATF
jgi:hypothetical protein